MIDKRLLILGAGQYGMVAKEVARSMGNFEGIDFLDDVNQIAVGKLDEYMLFRNDYNNAVVAIGNAVLRLELLDKLERCGYKIPILLHPNAYVSPSAIIEHGTIIEPMTVIHTDVRIGKGCLISAGTIVNHNSIVESGCHLNCGTIVASNSVVQSETKTECGARIIYGIER